MHKRLISVLIVIRIILLIPSAWAQTALTRSPLTPGSTQNGMVRVRLVSLGSPSSLTLTVYGGYTVNGNSDKNIPSGTRVAVNFQPSAGKWSISYNDISLSMGSSFRLCRHETSGQNGIRIGQGRVPGNLYPGDFEFIAKRDGASTVPCIIAHIYMEDYLYGVLPYEMGDSSGTEALKAQAVAARTYTMRAMAKNTTALWDVVDTTADQVYNGTPTGNGNCAAAVDSTKGIVVMNGATFTGTYYTASNGGQTESIENAWNTKGYPYLTVKDDPFDLANQDAKSTFFQVNASGAQSNAVLGRLLNQKAANQFGEGAVVTGVSAVTAHTPKYAPPSRLYTKLDFAVEYRWGDETGTGVLTFDIFSELEKPLSMNITSGSVELWYVSPTASGFTVTARRYGHGIGMSQRGAMYMAMIGYTYDQILAFYYEGCTRVQYTLTRSILSPITPGQSSTEQWIAEPPAQIDGSAPAETGAPAFSAQVITNSSALNMRSGPSESTSILCLIPRLAWIPVWEDDGAWCKTTYQGKTGYVSRSFLRIDQDEQPSSSPVPAPAATPAPAENQQPTTPPAYARVTTAQGSLNLRKEPNASAKVLRTIPQDTVILVLQPGDAWCRVTYEETTGYVMRSFLSFLNDQDAAHETPAPAEQGLRAKVTTKSGSLNLRESAKDGTRILTTIPQNEIVTVMERGNAWCRVAYGGKIGYAMTKYLSFLDDDASPSADPYPAKPNETPVNLGFWTLSRPMLGRVINVSVSLNLRSGWSMDAPILLEMPRDDYVIVYAVNDAWADVEYGGLRGYCAIEYLEFPIDDNE